MRHRSPYRSIQGVGSVVFEGYAHREDAQKLARWLSPLPDPSGTELQLLILSSVRRLAENIGQASDNLSEDEISKTHPPDISQSSKPFKGMVLNCDSAESSIIRTNSPDNIWCNGWCRGEQNGAPNNDLPNVVSIVHSVIDWTARNTCPPQVSLSASEDHQLAWDGVDNESMTTVRAILLTSRTDQFLFLPPH
jgi:hypothetical protein